MTKQNSVNNLIYEYLKAIFLFFLLFLQPVEILKFQSSKYEYTDEELKEIGKLRGQILAKMTKRAIKDFTKQVYDLSKQLEGGLERFLGEINNGVYRIICIYKYEKKK